MKTEKPYQPALLYVADPLCTWCYGFAPIITQLKGLLGTELRFRLLMGGMRPGNRNPLNPEEKMAFQQEWLQVEQRTGAHFNHHFLQREPVIFDSEPACRAMQVVKKLRPDMEFEIFRAMQVALFHDNEDITAVDELVELMIRFHIPENEFIELYNSERIIEATRDDFQYARRIGATQFPTLYVVQDGGPELVRRGYADLHMVEEQLRQRVPYLSIYGS